MNVYLPFSANRDRCRKIAAFPLTPAVSLGERRRFCREMNSFEIVNFIPSL